ncbi:MAG: DUF2845 domain-containing protein [Pseudomonadota bacterium]|nr:DUF2845 domain-containing protein [Pseudomonadota bacterium]
MKFIVKTSLFVSMLLPSQLLADTMTCGQSLVEPGDTEYQVEQKCGKPTTKEMNRWIYDRASQSFIYELNFEVGQLTHIVSRSRE